MHLLIGCSKVAVLGFEDIRNEFLRVAVDQGEPSAADLDHDLVPLLEAVVAPVQIDRVFFYLARYDRLRFFQALAESAASRFPADELLKAAQFTILGIIIGIHVDQAYDPVAIGSRGRCKQLRRQPDEGDMAPGCSDRIDNRREKRRFQQEPRSLICHPVGSRGCA